MNILCSFPEVGIYFKHFHQEKPKDQDYQPETTKSIPDEYSLYNGTSRFCLNKEDWFVNIDFTDGYFAVSIH